MRLSSGLRDRRAMGRRLPIQVSRRGTRPGGRRSLGAPGRGRKRNGPPLSNFTGTRYADPEGGQVWEKPSSIHSRSQRAGRQPPMLVLTRKSNQSIMIGDDIEVSVLAIMGEKVRIGIQAPRDIPVFRKEVYLEIQQERVGAGSDAREEVDAALRGLGDGSA